MNDAFTWYENTAGGFIVVGMNPFTDTRLNNYQFDLKKEAIDFCIFMNRKVNKAYTS